MNQRNKKAFTLLELLIVLVIIGVLITIAYPILCSVNVYSLNEDTLTVEQAINIAKSIAIERSKTICVDFSQANTSTSSTIGGPISIEAIGQTPTSNLTSSLPQITNLDSNIFYIPNSSTISHNIVVFNYQGQPMAATSAACAASTTPITTSNNTISIGYYKTGGQTVASAISVTIAPYTGNVTQRLKVMT